VLSDEQYLQFAEDGYLILPGAVREDLLAAADDEIDDVIASEPLPAGTVGPHFYFLPPGRLPAADAALRQSGGLQLAGELVAPHVLGHGLGHIQIALNIPPYPHRPGGPHIDGHRPGQPRPDSFTMLASVFLVDEAEADSGNLWVWPGSHLSHQRLFAERGAGALLPVSGQATMLEPPIELPAPRPVLAHRGDLLLAHFLLGHNIGGNITGSVRRVLYYRLRCDGHETRWAQTFLDAFTEYEPVRQRISLPGRFGAF
jgi:Phytanoyl-CoA dioxygenase (PhyH)